MNKHSLCGTKIYRAWQNVKDRCQNPNNPAFHNYGGRGVKMYPDWARDVMAFLAGVGHPPSPQHTLERMDNNGHYEPGNVCWATRKEQAQNLRKNRLLTLDGETKTMAAWAEIVGLAPSTLHYRMSTGMSDREAILTPPRGGRPKAS